MGKKSFLTLAAAALTCASFASPAAADPERDLLVAASQDRNDELYLFSSKTPVQARELRIVNPPAGRIVGLDRRPATQELWLTSEAMGSGSLSTVAIDPAAGTATLTPRSTITAPLSGQFFGNDFNPVPDRLRLNSDAQQNLRINVDTGATTVDGPLAYGDGREPDVVAAAYENSVAGATTTRLFDIDARNDLLAIQNPPNAGTLVPVGPLGVDVSRYAGFDITPPAAGQKAYAALLREDTPGQGSRLAEIDLASGRAQLGQKIGKDEPRLDSLAYVGEAG